MTRSMLSRGLALAGFAFMASSCNLFGGDDKPGSFTLSLSDAALTLPQSVKDTVIITITRSDYAKPVSLTLSGMPSGVAAAFSPGTLPSPGETSFLILTASGTASVGTYQVTVNANGEGVNEQTTTFELTIGVTGTYTLGAHGAPATAAQGGGASATILLNRTGGHADNVALSVTGAPAGVTASVGPASTIGAGATLTITAAAGAAVGTYPLTITGVAPGLSNKTTIVDLNVIAPPSTASVGLAFCSTRVPLWFAFQNQGYGWQSVSAAGTTFTFQATDKVVVAYTLSFSDKTEVHMLHVARSELAGWNNQDCTGPKSLGGSIIGATVGQSARVSMGVSRVVATNAAPAFTLTGVADRVLDLAATKGTITTLSNGIVLITPDMLLLRRAQNPVNNSSLGNLDFGSGEGFAPQSNAVTIGNTLGGDSFFLASTLWTGTNTYQTVQSVQPVSSTPTVFSVPAARLIAGDVQELYIEANQPGTSIFATGRTVASYIGGNTDHTETMAAPLSTATIATLTSSPYLRMLGQLPVQADYPSATRFVYIQGYGNPGARWVHVWVTAAFLGSTPSTWNVVTQDFSGVGGFNSNWMPSTTANMVWQADALSGPSGILFGTVPSIGDIVKGSYRVHQEGPALRAAEVRSAGSAFQYLRR